MRGTNSFEWMRILAVTENSQHYFLIPEESVYRHQVAWKVKWKLKISWGRSSAGTKKIYFLTLILVSHWFLRFHCQLHSCLGPANNVGLSLLKYFRVVYWHPEQLPFRQKQCVMTNECMANKEVPPQLPFLVQRWYCINLCEIAETRWRWHNEI